MGVDAHVVEELRALFRCWDRLDSKERQFIQRSVATANGLYETVKVLALLTERLQQRINELEESRSADEGSPSPH